ncbi:MAG TPA: hypothetical protein VGE74_29960 [Gemmata sp.]
MSPEALKSLLIRKPFLPFRLHVADQTSYDITKPDMVMIGGAVTFIGLVRNVQSEFFDEPVVVANRHITRLEPIVEEVAAK